MPFSTVTKFVPPTTPIARTYFTSIACFRGCYGTSSVPAAEDPTCTLIPQKKLAGCSDSRFFRFSAVCCSIDRRAINEMELPRRSLSNCRRLLEGASPRSEDTVDCPYVRRDSRNARLLRQEMFPCSVDYILSKV